MRHGSLICLLTLTLTLTGCPGGNAAIGERCADHGDCSNELQCMTGVCVPRCERAPECGDGYACDVSGICRAATGQSGDACTSEVDCVAGLSCQIEGTAVGSNGRLLASCVSENAGRPAGDLCKADGECRNGTCDLGHCVDLCTSSRDCGAGTSCTGVPRVAATGAVYGGCLQSRGSLRWSIPIQGPSDTVLLPIPEGGRGVSVLFTVEDQNQKVGATHVTAPSGAVILDAKVSYYANKIRHRPEFGQSVLAMPSSPAELVDVQGRLQSGVYSMVVQSLKLSDPKVNPLGDLLAGTATPTMTAVVKMDTSVALNLHFYFLNFDDHPCATAFDGKLDSQTAALTTGVFHTAYLTRLAGILNGGGLALGTLTFEDLRDHPDLDGLDLENAAALLALGSHAEGINVFFVRTLSPIGLQAIGPNPGPAGLPNTRQSGIVIGLDTRCYRTWEQLAELTAHELARYMGLYNNVEIDPIDPGITHEDPISDSDESSSNLMFYSEFGGVSLSAGQRDILRRSPVLQ